MEKYQNIELRGKKPQLNISENISPEEVEPGPSGIKYTKKTKKEEADMISKSIRTIPSRKPLAHKSSCTKEDLALKTTQIRSLSRDNTDDERKKYHSEMHITVRRKRPIAQQNIKGTKDLSVERNGKKENVEEPVGDPPRKLKRKKSMSYEEGKEENESKRISSKLLKQARKSVILASDSSKDKVTNLQPDWKEIKRRSSELKKERKSRKLTNFDKVVQAKHLFEEGRNEKCPAEKRMKILLEIHDILKADLTRLVYTHDLSRIIQWVIKLGPSIVRSSICDSIESSVVDMLQRKFARYVVKELLKTGDAKCITAVLNAVNGNVLKLMTNSISAPVVEYGYSKYATSDQKRKMEMEVYGNAWKVSTGMEMNTLKGLLEVCSNKSNTLEEVKENILKALAKGQYASTLIQEVSLEFMEVASNLQRDELLTSFKPHILDIICTKAGARISMQCCWYLPKKQKKSIMKSLKGNVTSTCRSDEGFWLLLALLDAVDDTVLLNKIIISEILDNVMEIMKHEKGRKVILYMVAHRDTTYFHPCDLQLLKQGDNSETVMKSLDCRRKEILEPVMAYLLPYISSNVAEWFQEPSISMVLLAILKNGEGTVFRAALQSIAEYISSNLTIPGATGDILLIEHSGFSHVLKKVLKNDLDKSDEKDTFALYLANAVHPETIKKWIGCNRGCFLLSSILETKKPGAIALIKNKLDDAMVASIFESSTAGGKVLSFLLKTSGVTTH